MVMMIPFSQLLTSAHFLSLVVFVLPPLILVWLAQDHVLAVHFPVQIPPASLYGTMTLEAERYKGLMIGNGVVTPLLDSLC